MRDDDLRVYKHRQEQATQSSTTSISRLNPAQQRQQKIDQYKRERAAENQLKVLRAQLDNIDKETNSDLDDVERDWVLAAIQLYIVKALQHLQSIDQELVMVKEMEAMANDRRRMMPSRSGQRQEEAIEVQRTLPPTWGRDKPLLNKQGRPLQPFVITNKRQQLQDQVFRPGWSLPTMTIDEYLEQEEERGNIIKGGYVLLWYRNDYKRFT